MNNENEFIDAANQREPKRVPQSVLTEQYAPKTMPNKVMSAKKKQAQKKAETPSVFSPKKIASLVCEVRGERVLLDADLAELYAVETRVLKQAVRRNIDRFPEDFMFELKPEEVDTVYLSRSQSVIMKRYDEQFEVVFKAIQQLLDEDAAMKQKPKRKMGFQP